MKVLMIPSLDDFGNEESGIKRVVEAYVRLAPQYGIEYVKKDEPHDLIAIHAGMSVNFDPKLPIVAHLHGLYWTNDYPADSWEWRTNAKVIQSCRVATRITVPSEWVAKTIQRDMHINPAVIHHGIDWQEWTHDHRTGGYALFNKNRAMDVCNPIDFVKMANQFPGMPFVTTFSVPSAAPNVREIGLRTHDEMKLLIQSAAVYVSITKETFGIGVLEALASGTPVLGYAWGGNLITVKHGVNGYLAKPGDLTDLTEGMRYCLKHRDILSANAKETVKEFTWEKAVEKVAQVYEDAIRTFNDKKRPYTI